MALKKFSVAVAEDWDGTLAVLGIYRKASDAVAAVKAADGTVVRTAGIIKNVLSGLVNYKTSFATLPVFISAASTSKAHGSAQSFIIMVTGNDVPVISKTSGALPTGVSLTDNGNRTATIGLTTGTSAGTVNIALQAVNEAGTATQTFVLTLT